MTVMTSTQTVPIEPEKDGSICTGTALISGTCIGGGMLAMPVQTAEVGFFLSFLGLFICWIFMTFTGLLLVEATLYIKNETHFSSLSRILIGNWAKIVVVTIYLFMNYASLVAYTAGGASLINVWVESLMNVSLGYEISCVVFTLLFGFVLFLGSQFMGRLNFWFMVGLALTYAALIWFGIGSIKAENLVFRPRWKESLGTFSIILATFSYQMVVPAVCSYLQYDIQKLRKAIILGTTIPFIIYSVWILVIHGAVPLDGENGLREAWAAGAPATMPLRKQLNHWLIVLLADSFAFFAIITSYLGLSLALFYFLKDCFKEININLKRNTIIFMSIFPTLVLAILFPRALLQCLDLSGGFGDTILSGLIPAALVWMGRYQKNLTSHYQVFGGKLTLIIIALFFFYILILQFF